MRPLPILRPGGPIVFAPRRKPRDGREPPPLARVGTTEADAPTVMQPFVCRPYRGWGHLIVLFPHGLRRGPKSVAAPRLPERGLVQRLCPRPPFASG